MHYLLTGENVLGVGEASGMFPIDSGTGDYDAGMLAAFDEKIAAKGYPWKLRGILPEVLGAGEDAGCLTEEGARTEASRCLRCDHYGYGAFRGGRKDRW